MLLNWMPVVVAGSLLLGPGPLASTAALAQAQVQPVKPAPAPQRSLAKPKPRGSQLPPPPRWEVEQASPRQANWYTRLVRFFAGLFQVAPGKPPYADPFTVDDPQRPWRQNPHR